MAKIKVQNTEITIINHDDKDYISLTDMAVSYKHLDVYQRKAFKRLPPLQAEFLDDGRMVWRYISNFE